MSKTAWSIVPDRFDDRRQDAIHEGLRRVGFSVKPWGGSCRPGDVFVTWSRSHHRGQQADEAERQGATIVVAEEGYWRRLNGKHWITLSIGDAAGAGWFPSFGGERWRKFGLELGERSQAGRDVIVTEQRGIGSKTMASPANWHVDTAARLRELTKRPIVIREHPKKKGPRPPKVPPAEEALANAWAVVTWSSAFACEALLRGVPTIIRAPRHVLLDCCGTRLEDVDDPPMGDRVAAFERLAWNMWNLDEVRTGQPFDLLLCRAAQAEGEQGR